MVASAALIGASAIGALGSIAGAGLSNAMSLSKAKELAEHQSWLNYKYNKKWIKFSALNNPNYTRAGLERAGYNPLLAVQSGQGIGPSNASAFDSSNPDSSPDLSGLGNNAVNTALNLRKQINENATTEATVNNTNADTGLKNAQALTEQYKQANLNIDSQVKEAQKRLHDLDISNYERNQVRKDIEVLTNYKRMLNDYELGTISNSIQGLNAQTNRMNAVNNATDIKSRIPINEEEKKIREWNAKHPVWSRLLPGSASSAISGGVTLLK